MVLWRWRSAVKWIHRLTNNFGSPFLILITCIYWTQGFRSLPWMTISYQLKDELKLTPSASQFSMTVAFLPWNIKPLYGILSDCIPINGSRRISYLILSSILSFIPWVLLGVFETMRMSAICMIGLLTVQNFGTAMADVVIDAMIAEAAREERTEYAGDLQSMSWFAMALGGIFGSMMGGFALSSLGIKRIFLLFSMFPVLQLVTCTFVDERKLGSAIKRLHTADINILDNTCADRNHHGSSNIVGNDHRESKNNDFPLNGLLQSCNIDEAGETKGLIPKDGEERYTLMHGKEDDDWVEVASEMAKDDSATEGHEGDLHCPESMNIAKAQNEESTEVISQDIQQQSWILKIKETFVKLHQTIQRPEIRRPMLWFFLAQISVPSLSTMMFYYQTNHLHLDASFLGTSRFVGWGSLMLGTFIYNQYLKNVPLRKILGWTHIVLALITLSDVILVSGLNKQFGIPDKAFIIGASALGDSINQFKFMPFLVLSGQLCEPGIEGTLFALFMSLNNLGATLSSLFGASLASTLHISSNGFENFSTGICVQALFTLLPVFFLHLIPPNDKRALGKKKV